MMIKAGRCIHIHASGRRCNAPAPKNGFCSLHKGKEFCRDCQSMMQTFTPPRGW